MLGKGVRERLQPPRRDRPSVCVASQITHKQPSNFCSTRTLRERLRKRQQKNSALQLARKGSGGSTSTRARYHGRRGAGGRAGHVGHDRRAEVPALRAGGMHECTRLRLPRRGADHVHRAHGAGDGPDRPSQVRARGLQREADFRVRRGSVPAMCRTQAGRHGGPNEEEEPGLCVCVRVFASPGFFLVSFKEKKRTHSHQIEKLDRSRHLAGSEAYATNRINSIHDRCAGRERCPCPLK